MPGPSMLLAPVTLTLGPAVTFNLIMLASPALSAWTAFLLCRHVTGRVGPSLLAGYVFGFSPYMLTVLTGAPNLAFVPLIPVLALLVIRRLDGSLRQRPFVAAMTATLIAQYLTSTEVLLSATLFGGVALVAAFLLLPDRRRALLEAVGLLAIAYAGMAVVVSPFLLEFFLGDHYPPIALYFSTDLAAFVLPPYNVVLTKTYEPEAAFRGSTLVGYVGLPLLGAAAAYLWQHRRTRVAWLLVICMAVPAILALGPGLILRGELTDITLPWELFDGLPVLRYVIVSRFSLYVFLAGAVVLSHWLAHGGRLRWAVALLVVASILPAIWTDDWHSESGTPAFFRDHRYRAHIKPDDRVLIVPVGGPNERWQAETGFDFDLVGGYLGTGFPDGYTRFPTWTTLRYGRLTPDYATQLRRFVRAKQVDAIVVQKRTPGPWLQLFASLPTRPLDTGGVLLYRVTPTS
jgi:hypothetical protein